MQNIKSHASYIALFLFSFVYLNTIIIYAYDLPNAYDDLKAFVEQFSSLFLEIKPAWKKLFYFFESTNHPHPQITVRISALISYLIFGEIDFFFINLLGSISFPIFIYLLIKWDFLNLPLCILVSSILLVPLHHIVFWKVATIGSWLIIFVFSTFFYAFKEKYPKKYINAFLASFSSGIGVGVLPFTFIILLLKKANKRILLSYLMFCSVIIYLFYTITIEGGSNINKVNNNVDLNDCLIKLVGLISLIGQSINSVFKLNGGPAQLVIGTIVLIVALYQMIVDIKSNKLWTEKIVQYCFLMFISALIFITSFLRFNYQDDGNYWNVHIPRYEIFSTYFIIAVILIFDKNVWQFNSSFKIQKFFVWLLVLFSIGIYFKRFEDNVSRMKQKEEFYSNRFLNNLLKLNTSSNYYDESFTINAIQLLNKEMFTPNISWFSDDFIVYENCDMNGQYNSILNDLELTILNDLLFFHFTLEDIHTNSKDFKTDIILSSEDECGLYRIMPLKSKDLKFKELQTESKFYLMAVIKIDELKSRNYDLFISVDNNLLATNFNIKAFIN